MHSLQRRAPQSPQSSPVKSARPGSVACQAVQSDFALRVRGRAADVYTYVSNPANLPSFCPGELDAGPRRWGCAGSYSSVHWECNGKRAAPFGTTSRCVRQFGLVLHVMLWGKRQIMLWGKRQYCSALSQSIRFVSHALACLLAAIHSSTLQKGAGPDIRSRWLVSQSIGKTKVDVTWVCGYAATVRALWPQHRSCWC